MATTDGVNSGTTAADALTGSAGSVQRTANSSLGKDDFLKLLVGQMQNMDPLGQGKDPSDTMAQMTQYSMLEQMQNINSATQRSSTIGLIGHTVSYTQADGSTVEGNVDQVTTVGGKLALVVGGKPGINPDSVVEVR
jgi:flagellar basal-body rod modification protein FlgD